MIGGPPVTSKIDAGDADPSVRTDNEPGATGISCREMPFIVVRVKAMDQERPAVPGKAKTGHQFRCRMLVKEVPSMGQASGRPKVSQQSVTLMPVAGKMNHEISPRGKCGERDTRNNLRGNRTVEFDEGGIPYAREPLVDSLGVKVNCFPLTAGFSGTGRKFNETSRNAFSGATGHDVSRSEDVAATRQKGSGGGKTEWGVYPNHRCCWRNRTGILLEGPVDDDGPRRSKAQEGEQGDSYVAHPASNRETGRRFSYFPKKSQLP